MKSQVNDSNSETMATNLEILKHIRKLGIKLLDIARQFIAQNDFLDTFNFLALFEPALDCIQFAEVR
jgi:hypothetical protein